MRLVLEWIAYQMLALLLLVAAMVVVSNVYETLVELAGVLRTAFGAGIVR